LFIHKLFKFMVTIAAIIIPSKILVYTYYILNKFFDFNIDQRMIMGAKTSKEKLKEAISNLIKSIKK